MAFSPFARFRNFTRDYLKDYLKVYPDMSSKLQWNDAIKDVETRMPGYKKTAYQQACQFGIEDRSGDEFRVHSFLDTFDDDYLDKYLGFWIKTYYAPNPYVNSTDAPMLIYCELAEEALLSPSLEVDYDAFFLSHIGGGSEDILMNAIKEFGAPLKYKKDGTVNKFYVEKKDEAILREQVTYIKSEYPIINPMDRKTFFERFSYDNFCKFWRISCRATIPVPEVKYESGYVNSKNFSRNRIIFGAPGTGKSFRLNSDKDILITSKMDYERVTFHPDYTYSQFVGAYKPVTKKDNTISYEFVPGPFMRVLVMALKNIVSATDYNTNSVDTAKVKPFVLLIEEINRAKAAAVFGDIFQLLDRNSKHVSEYELQPSEEIREFLAKQVGGSPDNYVSIKIPDNMYIWATMNSADQGVYPMDTAFKRRWTFEYIGVDDEEYDAITKKLNVPGYFTLPNGKKIEWNAFRKAINELLSSDEVKINEDKLLGPFFIHSSKYLKPGSADELDDEFYRLVENKVLMYLFEDAAKTKKAKVFVNASSVNRFSKLCELFEDRDISIFKGLEKETFEECYLRFSTKKTTTSSTTP